MRKTVILPLDVLEKLRAACQQASPDEACAILVGEKGAGGWRIDAAYVSENVSDLPATSFLLDVRTQFEAQRQARQNQQNVIGVFHSHPTNEVYPSHRDIQMGKKGNQLWLIADGTGTTMAAFSFSQDGQVWAHPLQVENGAAVT